jgi:hypothetical protein
MYVDAMMLIHHHYQQHHHHQPSMTSNHIEQQLINEDKAFRVNLWQLLGTL